jgi:hypothetical protein
MRHDEPGGRSGSTTRCDSFPGADGIFHLVAISSVPRPVKNPFERGKRDRDARCPRRGEGLRGAGCLILGLRQHSRFRVHPRLIRSDDRSGVSDPLQTTVPSSGSQRGRTTRLQPVPGTRSTILTLGNTLKCSWRVVVPT